MPASEVCNLFEMCRLGNKSCLIFLKMFKINLKTSVSENTVLNV